MSGTGDRAPAVHDAQRAKPPFVLLSHVLDSESPSWDVVVGDHAVHYIRADATAQEAQLLAVQWLSAQYGDGDVEWEAAGDSAYIGRWPDP